MKAKKVVVTILMNDYRDGAFSAYMQNARDCLPWLDFVINRQEDVEVEDLRGLEVNWEDWFR